MIRNMAGEIVVVGICVFVIVSLVCVLCTISRLCLFPVFSSISLDLLPERAATLMVYDDVVEIVSDFQGNAVCMCIHFHCLCVFMHLRAHCPVPSGRIK